MASWDANYFFIDWHLLHKLKSDFWKQYLDINNDSHLLPICNSWIVEADDDKFLYLDRWEMAQCAFEAYETIRMLLGENMRRQTDFIFSQLFGFSRCNYWPNFVKEENPWLEAVRKADFCQCIAPDTVQLILDWLQPDLMKEIEKVFPNQVFTYERGGYLEGFEGFFSYIMEWKAMLMTLNKRKGWGLLIFL